MTGLVTCTAGCWLPSLAGPQFSRLYNGDSCGSGLERMKHRDPIHPLDPGGRPRASQAPSLPPLSPLGLVLSARWTQSGTCCGERRGSCRRAVHSPVLGVTVTASAV